MPLLKDFTLAIDADAVLRAQGADPAQLRVRNPRLAALAEEAIAIGGALLAPRAAGQLWEVESLRHGTVFLHGGKRLGGAQIAQFLAGARQVAAIVATIGEAVETRVAELLPANPSLALALDGFGSAAVEALCMEVCRRFGEPATPPFSPGLEGWPLETGQRELFALLDSAEIGVRLTDSSLMLPRKSASFVAGLGPGVKSNGSPCDFCQMKGSCRYRRPDGVRA